MKRTLLLLSLPLALAADERWIEVRSGPFEVLSSAGNREAGRAMAYLEQLRNALGLALGKPELITVWPVRVVLFRNARERNTYPRRGLESGRDAHLGALVADAPVPREFSAALARILIEDNTGRLPPSMDRGLVTLLSTLEVKGVRVTLGAPPPPAERDLDWARMHLLSVNPEYSGKLRVLLGNLSRGGDAEPSYRNAFQKSLAEIEKEAAAYLAAGRFETAGVSARPIDPERDFPAKPVEGARIRRVLAELAGSALPEAEPGARALVESRLKEKDPAKARAALEKAARINPRWAEPQAQLARLEADPEKKIQRLKTATTLDPRSVPRWVELAQAAQAAKFFSEASKAWFAAEHAAATEEERARLRRVRAEFDEKRQDAEAAERKRIADEKQRELERLRQEALAQIRAAEERANRGKPPTAPNRKVEAWWDGPRPDRKVSGLLQRVDCIRGQARLVLRGDDGKTLQLLVREPSQVVILGGGERTLACGPQRPPRRVAIEFFTKPDPKMGTAGEAATVESR